MADGATAFVRKDMRLGPMTLQMNGTDFYGRTETALKPGLQYHGVGGGRRGRPCRLWAPGCKSYMPPARFSDARDPSLADVTHVMKPQVWM